MPPIGTLSTRTSSSKALIEKRRALMKRKLEKDSSNRYKMLNKKVIALLKAPASVALLVPLASLLLILLNVLSLQLTHSLDLVQVHHKALVV